MNSSPLHVSLTKIRTCALVMLGNATYILGELPTLGLTSELRAQTEQVCAALIGTKHDIFSELFELDELLGSGAPAAQIGSRLDRMSGWIQDDLSQLHELVLALETASNQDPAYQLAYVLVTESAANILNAFA